MKRSKPHHRSNRLLKHIAVFYAYWAIGFHILYILDLVPNTFMIATLVLVVSQIIFWIYPGHAYKHGQKIGWILNELLAHWLPFIVFLLLEDTVVGSYEIIFMLLTIMLYVLTHGYDAIYNYYTRMHETVLDIRHH